MNILFVCTGNTCRSAMAQGIAKKIIQSDPARFGQIKVASAGTYGQEGEAASNYAQQVAQEHGVDLTGFVAQQVTPQLLNDADLVLAMTGSHKMLLNTLAPEAMDKIFLLKEYEYGENINALNVRLNTLFETYGAVRENFVKGHQAQLAQLDDLGKTDPAAAEALFQQLNVELTEGVRYLDDEINDIHDKLQKMEIVDPVGGSPDEYRMCYEMLAESIAVLLEKIVSQQ